MSDHFSDVQHDLLVKDSRLLQSEIGDLSTLHVDESTVKEIDAVRDLLAEKTHEID